MKKQYAMITKLKVVDPESAIAKIRTSNWKQNESIYLRDSELLLVSFAESSQDLLAQVESNAMAKREDLLREQLHSDWSRQIVKYVTTAKDAAAPFENSAYLQLRYIEVPAYRYNEYSAWRESTIFSHVRKQEPIDFFHAYHTVVSTQPGVMFLAGFSCSENEYKQLFENDHYREIIRQAGSRYIVDGENGLYTHIYKRV